MAKEFRVTIVGKTGVGKSALGNSLVGQGTFQSALSASSTSQHCEIDETHTSIGRLKVVDTPGLFDIAEPNDERIKELVKCVGLLAPGPHVFIFVFSAETSTQIDIDTIQILKQTFGEDFMRHVIVVFTRKDQLTDTTDKFIQSTPEFMKQLLNDVNDRYEFICNLKTNSSHEHDVENVLTLIKNTVQQNGGNYYTPEIFQAVEAAIQKEIEEKQKRGKKSAEECRQEIQTNIVNNEQSTVEKKSAEECRQEIQTNIVKKDPSTVDKISDSVTTMVTTATPYLCEILFQYVKMKMQQRE